MNKTQLNEIKSRITGIVQCTNGTLATKINEQKRFTNYTIKDQLSMIRNGKAQMLSDKTIENLGGYSDKQSGLLACFKYPLTAQKKKDKAHDKRLQAKLDEVTLSVTRAGDRLYDDIMLGILPKEDIPAAYTELSKMAELL